MGPLEQMFQTSTSRFLHSLAWRPVFARISPHPGIGDWRRRRLGLEMSRLCTFHSTPKRFLTFSRPPGQSLTKLDQP